MSENNCVKPKNHIENRKIFKNCQGTNLLLNDKWVQLWNLVKNDNPPLYPTEWEHAYTRNIHVFYLVFWRNSRFLNNSLPKFAFFLRLFDEIRVHDISTKSICDFMTKFELFLHSFDENCVFFANCVFNGDCAFFATLLIKKSSIHCDPLTKSRFLRNFHGFFRSFRTDIVLFTAILCSFPPPNLLKNIVFLRSFNENCLFRDPLKEVAFFFPPQFFEKIALFQNPLMENTYFSAISKRNKIFSVIL